MKIEMEEKHYKRSADLRQYQETGEDTSELLPDAKQYQSLEQWPLRSWWPEGASQFWPAVSGTFFPTAAGRKGCYQDGWDPS